MSNKNPIKFLDSYSKDDKDIFFGREKETSDLYEKVSKSRVVLLYGLSGTGKTSLIQCGLENRYEADQQIFIYIRRGNNLNNSFKQSVSAEASTLIHPNSGPEEALETLYYDYLKPIIIIFDQFEELFISGDLKEKQQFISTIANILASELRVKFIFSLREEYLAHMDEFEEEIPNIYDLRQRLEKMRRSTLEDVITRISEKGGLELENEQVPGLIIDNISDRKGHVELPYLQVYLDKLSKLLIKKQNGKVLTRNFLEEAGELKDVLGDFLEEQINLIASEISSKEAINHLLKQLITHEGTKRQIVFADIKPYGNTSPDQIKTILAKLEESRIIKLEDGVYEFSHDSLAKKIAEKRTSEEIQLIEVIKFLKNALNSNKQTDTLLDRKQIKYIQPYLHLIEISDEEQQLIIKSRNKVKKLLVIRYGIYAIIIIAILSGGYLWQDKRYNDKIREGDNFMKEAKYPQAILMYDQALDYVHWHILTSNKVKEKKIYCEEQIRNEKPYRKLIRAGDSLFVVGVSQYKNAFTKYYEAAKLGYDTTNTNNLISEKTNEAVSKLVELAIIEHEAGHKDIALTLISDAYILSGRNSIKEQINEWLLTTSNEELSMAIHQLEYSLDNEYKENKRAESLLNELQTQN